MLRQNPVSYENLTLEQLLKPSIPYKSTLRDALHEATTMPYLQAIDMMPQKIFGLNPFLALKFKALLKIIAFNFIIKMKKWSDADYTFMNTYLPEISEELCYLALAPDTISRDEEYSKIINKFKNFLKLRAFIFSSDIIFDENKFDISITKIAAEFSIDHDSLEATIQKIFGLLSDVVYDMDIEVIRKSAKKFDLTTLNPTIHRNRSLNVAALCAEVSLQNKADALTLLNDIYISAHLDFEAFLDTVISRMDNSFNVDKKSLSMLYQAAFMRLHDSKTVYFKHSEIQLYLQQLRKPEQRSEIFSIIDRFTLSSLTDYYKSLGKDKTIDIKKMTDWTNRICSDSPLLLSLHQVLNTSYRQLLSPYIANCSEDEDHYDAITPVLSTTVDNSLLPEQLFTGFKPQTEVKGLFKGEIPGTIRAEDIVLLNSHNLALPQYQNDFDTLCQREYISNEDFRAAAVRLFEDSLKNATSIHAIAALLEVAEPYINLHQNPRVDEKFGKNITKTWGKMIKLARTEGMEFLKKEVASSDDKKAGIDTLNYWRNKNLFAQHRTNFKITGAFGRTKAQDEIDTMTKRIRKS